MQFNNYKQKLIHLNRHLNNKGLRATVRLLFAKTFNRVLRVTKQSNRAVVERPQKTIAVRVELIKQKYPQFSDEQAQFIALLFLAEHYTISADLPDNTNQEEAFLHYLEQGLITGAVPGPLFNVDTYLSRISQKIARSEAFLHWLNYGLEQRIVPTVLFDQAVFSSATSSQSMWSFKQFLQFGLYADKPINAFFDAKWYRNTHKISDNALPAFYHYLTIGYLSGYRPAATFPAYTRQSITSMICSPLEEVMMWLDVERNDELNQFQCSPELNLIKQAKDVFAVLNDPVSIAEERLLTDFKNEQYDNVVLIPRCGVGGAGFVAGKLCYALGRLMGMKTVLLVRTDHDLFARPDWFPEQITMLNILDYGADLPNEQRKILLLALLTQVKAKRIFNVHSLLAWQTYCEEGKQLSELYQLYGYSFCYDLNFMGKKVGYPVKYVPTALPYLTALFVDNNYLKSDLVESNHWTRAEQAKIHVLKTPFTADESLVAQINQQQAFWEPKKQNQSDKKVIFWAGRFDRQKRFDIVIELAEQNPNYEFWVWGKAMLGEELDETSLPKNIQQKGLFSDFSELPFEECDVWLYTSQWDGIPTLLIELGLRAIPIVATRVWGTADVISEKTAWPVDDILNVADYQAGIDYMAKYPEIAEQRGKALQRFILSEHDETRYYQALKKLLKVGDQS